MGETTMTSLRLTSLRTYAPHTRTLAEEVGS